MKIGITVGVVIAVLALVASLVPLKEVPYTATVKYRVTETYYETVPLSYEARSYVKEDTMKQRRRIVIGGIVIQDVVVKIPIQVAHVEVKNTDTRAGIFEVVFSVVNPIFGSPSLNVKLELAPGQVKTATCPAEKLGEWKYSVKPSTKSIERQRTVWKERLETRYKKVTLLDYLLHYYRW